MLNIFEKYKDKIFISEGKNTFTYNDIKKQIAFSTKEIKPKKDNVVILSGDNYSFVINFFASLFCEKNIFLITDKKRLNDLPFDYDILGNATKKEERNFNFPKFDTKKGLVNFFTSGSTGAPQVIKKSYFNLYKEGKDIGETFDFKGCTVKSTTTMCHLFGLTFHLMTSFVNGLTIDTDTVLYPENADKDNLILVSTPAFLSRVDENDVVKHPKYIISAGSKLDEKVFKKWGNFSKIIEIYGSSETGIIAHKTHYNSDFRVFDNVKLNVNDDFVEVLSDYSFENPVRINDKIEISNGNLKFKNRTDRLFKINEKRVSAEELEQKLKLNDYVSDCYILKVKDRLACLCSLSKKGQDFLLKNSFLKMSKELKTHLLKYSEIVPRKWKFIDKIPYNYMGKTDKSIINHIFNVNISLPVILGRNEEKDSIIYKLYFYRQCNFFKGHFPGFPIVPGVFQIYFAKELANYHFGLNLGEGQWKRIKFSNIIKPDSIVNLKLEKNEKQVFYEYFYDEKKYASGVFLCENIFKECK